ncbi:MAG: polysaccharide deacetylase [Bacillales bacterium]|jgi:peptidoglycan/xylan/chitin deacetylase (PgdA/CDA1 family)|nr:polysaccharide deacetylase [Bacillales bacterium]
MLEFSRQVVYKKVILMLKQRINVKFVERLKRLYLIVALVVVVSLLFVKYGYSMVFMERASGLIKQKNNNEQKITYKKPSRIVKSQNETIQKISFVKNSTNISDSTSVPFVDPVVEPRFIRKVEALLVEKNGDPNSTSKNGYSVQSIIDASSKYPLLYAKSTPVIENQNRIVYLTFDDGPSPVTVDVLEVLKSRGIKATFFVVGNQVELYPDILKRIADDGHAIGIHTNTHIYEEVYASLDSFLADYEQCFKKIKVVTDYPITVTRYPGGSNNIFNKEIREQTREELKRRGFSYFDWNVSSGDSAPKGITSEQFVNNVIRGVRGKNVAVILTHDAMGRTVTAESIGTVIDEITKMGYQFGVLGNNIETLQF